jgi:hypothetical protein
MNNCIAKSRPSGQGTAKWSNQPAAVFRNFGLAVIDGLEAALAGAPNQLLI